MANANVLGGLVGGGLSIYQQKMNNELNDLANTQYNDQIMEETNRQYKLLYDKQDDINKDSTNAIAMNSLTMAKQHEKAMNQASYIGGTGSLVDSMLKDINITGGLNQTKIINQTKDMHESIAIKGADIQSNSQNMMKTDVNSFSFMKALQTGMAFSKTGSAFEKSFNDLMGIK